MLLQLVIVGLVIGAFYSLVAVGFTVYYGTVRLINFAHGDTYMIGAFIAFTVLSALGAAGGKPVGIALAILATICTCGLLGLGMRWVYARVDAARSKLSPLIAAVGLSIVLENAAMQIWGSMPSVYPVQFPANGFKVLIALAAAVFVLACVDFVVGRTRFGLAMRAVGMDHTAVRLMGIRVETVVFITFFGFSAIAGVTGVLSGLYYGSINFLMGFTLGIKGFTAAVFGGVGNVRGALLGGFLLGLIETVGGGYLGTQWTDVISFAVLVLLLAFRPTGILGETIVERM